MLSVVMLNAIYQLSMLSVIMLTVVMQNYSECRGAPNRSSTLR